MRTLMTSLACCSFLLFAAACGDDDDDDGTPQIDGGDGNIDGGGGNTLDCASYCAEIAANCTGANRQYGGGDSAAEQTPSCLTMCATWDTGTLGEMTNNTLGCRLYHAEVAAANAGLHCIHAGPTGGSAAQCGDPCESFCTAALEACTGKANEQFGGDMATCMTECAAFDTDPPYSANVTTMDSFACRMYHLTVASVSAENATTHCPHISTASAAAACAAAP